MEQQHLASPSLGFQPSYLQRQKVRFNEEENQIIPNDNDAQQTTVEGKQFEKFWYTRNQLIEFRSAVQQQCVSIYTAVNLQNDSKNGNSTDGSGPMMIADDNDDDDHDGSDDSKNEMESANTTCCIGVEPYLDPDRCTVRSEMIQTLVEYNEQLLDLQELCRLEGKAPCPDRTSLLLARMAVRATRTHRLRAFEEGHVNFCQVYPERAMESPRQWEAYRMVLQRREQRQRKVMQQQQQQQQQQPAAPPQKKQEQAERSTVSASFTVIPMDDDNLSPQTIQTNGKRRRIEINSVRSGADGDEDDDDEHSNCLRNKRLCIR